MLYNRIPITIGEFQLITGPTVSYQYDIEQYLVFNSVTLPDYYTVDFCNVGDSQTVTITGTPDGVRIPDELLLTGRDIKAYVVLTGTDEGAVETRYEITLPVRNRPMRQGVTPTPEERLEIETLVNALNDGVTRAEDAATDAESQADRAETAADNAQSAVEHYPKIEDGYWYVWLNGGWFNTGVKAEGVDGKGIVSVTGQKTSTSGLVDTYTLTVTYTDSTTDTLTFTVTNGRDGVDGYSPTATVTKSGSTSTITITDKNGTTTATVTDGVSPGVTITDITGGHRVTITDKDYPTGQSFDVMDGEVSAADLQAVADSKAPVIIDTASGAIASFSDGADGYPVKSLVCQINPQQDLHGQDAPYPAGGGKNKVDINNPLSSSPAVSVQNDVIVGTNGYTNSGIVYEISGLTVGSPYYASVVVKTNTTGYRIAILVVDGGTGESYTLSTGTIGFTFNPTNETVQIKVEQRANGNWSADQLQLETGTSKTEFAPYSNECPINGWTGLSLTRDGDNLLARTNEGVPKTSNGVTFERSGDDYIITVTSDKSGYPFAKIGELRLKKGTYTLSFTSVSGLGIRLVDRNVTPANVMFGGNQTFTFTVSDEITPILSAEFTVTASNISVGTYIEHPMLVIGNTAFPYKPYQGETIPISWQDSAGTVYGGNISLTAGVLTANRKTVTLDGSQNVSASSNNRFYFGVSGAKTINAANQGTDNSVICDKARPLTWAGLSYNEAVGTDFCCAPVYGNGIAFRWDSITTAADWKTYFTNNPTQFSYELQNPITVQLDPITLNTLYGQNNIFADCGDVEVTYPCDTKLYIDRPTEPAEDDMIADTLIASGKYFFVNNRLFLSTASIAVGAMIIPGSNCVETSIAEALNTLNS